MATIKDVAHALNISYSTVSAILRGRGLELRFSEETCANRPALCLTLSAQCMPFLSVSCHFPLAVHSNPEYQVCS